jgi:hypothetical protein
MERSPEIRDQTLIYPLPLDGGGYGPAPRRMQDLALNLIWFRGGGELIFGPPSPQSPPTRGGELFGGISPAQYSC